MNERVVFPFIPSLTLTLTMDAQEPLPIPDSSYRGHVSGSSVPLLIHKGMN